MLKDTKGDKSDPRVWSTAVSHFDFYCPSEDCYQSHLRINTMFAHMKLCLRRSKKKKFKDYSSIKIKCPECDRLFMSDTLYTHFRKDHLLLNWYFGEVEKGNWAVCQNYKCAKYLDTIDEIVRHFHLCKYLWKCKYCDIEYDNEPQVQKHHCCTSSEKHSDEEHTSDISVGELTKINIKEEPLENIDNNAINNVKLFLDNVMQPSNLCVGKSSVEEDRYIVKPTKKSYKTKQNKLSKNSQMFNVEVKLENIKQEADLVHDLLPRTKNIKERTSRRKSAVRAIEKLSSIVKFNSGIKKPKRLLSLQDDEEYGSTNTSTNTSNNTSDNDDEYKLPTNQRSSSENESDSEGEEDSSASYSDSDGGVSDSTSAYLFHKKTVRRGDLYDELFFEQWLEDHTPTDDLFKSLLPSKNNIIFLSESEYSKYLPKSGYSPDIEISYYSSFKQRKATETLSLKNFKAMPSLHGSTSVAFNVGGSIWGLDWCPVPSTDDQYLAVSAHSMYSKVHSLLNGSADSGLIQIWHIGKLNKEKKSSVQPRLSLCICHDYGPVYDIKWCPTGCYMKEDGRVIRLGLLAVACGDGKVRLYSIPSPDKFPQDDNVFVKLEPCLVLLPHKQDSIETIQTGACMSLSWQFTAKERKIAAGFADGCLRIWNPDTNSIFLKTDFNGNPAVLPIIQIDAHSFAVRSLSWCPYNSDLIATGSKDKTVKVFNIKEPCYPLFVFKRGFPLNIEWPIPRIGFFLY